MPGSSSGSRSFGSGSRRSGSGFFCSVLGVLCLALRPPGAGGAALVATADGEGGGAAQLPIDAIFFVENSTFPSEGYAVERLSHWLSKACGGSAPAVVAQQPAGGRWLAVGHLAATAAGLAPPAGQLTPPRLAPPTDPGNEAFTILCGGKGCAVSGGEASLRGTMYGVYHLLEEHWGFKFLAWDTVIVPSCPSALPSANATVTPSMNYRQISDVYTEPAPSSCVVNPNCTHKGCSKLW